ncbi:MAG: hypothetical protein Q4C30_00765 [Bacteroidia bacterium]|nr:hypothetical protein [Bacteroidia bacterium]
MRRFDKWCRCGLGVVITLLSCVLLGCESEYSTPSNTDALVFSVDTLSFDTLFVGDKSETYALKLYNRSNKNILIDQILLEGGEESSYTIDIDGDRIPSVSDIELAAKDSLYIFVDIRCPFIPEYFCNIRDKITLRVGTHTKSAVIETYVQNVNILDNVTICHNTTLDSPIPYRVYGKLEIKENSTLTVAPGTKIYMAHDAQIDVYGSIVANGELSNKITIHGDKLTKFYDNVPGQWNSVNIRRGAHAYIRHTEISNAKSALQVDSTAMVDIESSIIRDASVDLINSRFANLTILNSLLYNCGKSIIDDQCSDIYIVHTTISNRFSWDYRKTPSLMLLPYEERYGSIEIANSIIEGNHGDELLCDSESMIVDHCAVSKEKTDIFENDPRYIDVVSSRKIIFADVKGYDFHLKSDMEAKGDGKYAEICPIDIDGTTRDTLSPTIGAFECPTSEE